MNVNATNNSVGQNAELSWPVPKSYHALFFCLFYASIVLTIVGNVLVILVLVVRKRLSLGVRCSLVNLAIADLFSAIICMPFAYTQYLYGYWQYSPTLCSIILFTDRVAIAISVLTLSAIGIDRYLAILYPLKFHFLRSDKAVIVRTITIWAITIVACVVFFVYPSVFPYPYNGVSCLLCWSEWPSEKFGVLYSSCEFAITYVIPLTILTFAYTSIIIKLYHRTSPGNADTARDLRHHQSNVIKMLVLTLASFILFWTPVQIYYIVWNIHFDAMSSLDHVTNNVLFITFYWISTVNCFLDPIIYCISNNNFWGDLRHIFRNIIQICKGRRIKLSSQMSTQSSNTVSQFSISRHT